MSTDEAKETLLNAMGPVARCRACAARAVRLYRHKTTGEIACNLHVPWADPNGWLPLLTDPMDMPVGQDGKRTIAAVSIYEFLNKPEACLQPEAPTFCHWHGWTTAREKIHGRGSLLKEVTYCVFNENTAEE